MSTNDVGVAVHADHAALPHLCGVLVVDTTVSLGRLDALDDLDLVRLVGEQCLGLGHRHLGAHERLIRLDDLTHLRLDAFEVVVAERGAAGEFEVVVEAVLDGGSDGELRTREQAGHRLSQHMGGRVAEHMAPFVRAGRDDRHHGAIMER